MSWYNSAWQYALPVTVTNTSSTSALRYCQVPIALSGSAYTSFHAHAKSDGSDIMVTDSDGTTTLPFALEQIDTANSVAYLLVKLSLAANASKTIYLYYGNPAATSASSYPSTVQAQTTLAGPTDILTQANYTGYNSEPQLVCLKNQNGTTTTGTNGILLAVCTVLASGNSGTNGSLAKLVSTDGGTTWTLSTLLATTVGNAAHARALKELADGTVLLIYDYDTNGNENAGVAFEYCAKTTDGGVTWTNLSNAPTNPIAVPWTYHSQVGVVFNTILQTAGGDLLASAYGEPSGHAVFGAYLLSCPNGSDPTNGSNWSTKGTIAYDGTHSWTETAVAFGADTAHLIAISREETGGDLWRTASTDGGATWGTPVALGMPPTTAGPAYVSPALLLLASGHTLLCFGNRNSSSPQWGSLCALSTDGCASFQDRPFAPASGYAAAGQGGVNFGYPAAAQRADGTIVLLDYHEVGSNAVTTNIGCSRFTEEWVANQANLYSACQSTASLTSPGANVTADATHTLNGAATALRFDNSAGTAASAIWTLATDPALAGRNLALTAWRYDSQVASNQSNDMELDDASGNRVADFSALGTSFAPGIAGEIQWYNGSAYVASGLTAIATPNQWLRHDYQLASAATAGATTGSITLNNGTPYTGVHGWQAGAGPNRVKLQAGTGSTTTNSTFWLGRIYTHQYVASIPTTSVGSELVYVPPPVIVSSSVNASSPINTVTQSGRTVITGIVATGTNQASAYRLGPYDLLAQVVSTPSGSGVMLPSFRIGSEVYIRNDDPSNALAIYPAAGGMINSLAANAPYSLGAGASVTLRCIALGRWVS